MNISKLKRLISSKAVRVFDRPSLILVFGAGWIGGMTLRLPFFPWMLNEGASTVFGASAGALIGAACAGVIAVNVTTKDAVEARSDVAKTVGPVRQTIAFAMNGFKNSPATPRAAAREVSTLILAVQKARARLNIFRESDKHTRAAGVFIADAIDALDRAIDPMQQEVTDLNNGFKAETLFGQSVPVSVRFQCSMDVLLEDLKKIETELR